MKQLFSQSFANEVFNQKAADLQISHILECNFTNTDVVWQSLLEYANNLDVLQQRNRNCEAVCAVNTQRTSKLDTQLTPKSDDGSINGYISRIEQIIGKDEWSVAFFGLHSTSQALWDSVQWFSKELSRSVGASPGGRVDIDCFIGRYSSTHTGVHVDNAHNFAFTLNPGKTMYTWTPAYEFLLGKKSPNYDAWKNESTALVNKPNQISYFPPDALHVAESRDSVSVVINVALWEESEGGVDTKDFLSGAVSNRFIQKAPITASGAEVLYPHITHKLTPVRSVFSNAKSERDALVHQMRSTTSERMGVGRPPVDISYSDLIDGGILSSHATVQWAVTSDSQNILVGVNGHVIALPYSSRILTFLRSVLSAQTITYSLVKSHMQDELKNTIMAIYYRLFQWGAIVKG